MMQITVCQPANCWVLMQGRSPSRSQHASYSWTNAIFQVSLKPRRRLRKWHMGISLLEVVISIGILAMSAGLLAQLIQNATNNALDSRDELQANLICESKLAEVALQAIPMQSSDWALVTDQNFTTKEWYFRIDAVQSNQPDIMTVTVFVGDTTAAQNQAKPIATLTRWFINPMLNMDLPAPADGSASGNATSSSSSSGPSSSGTGL